jgi:hypothetical protein
VPRLLELDRARSDSPLSNNLTTKSFFPAQHNVIPVCSEIHQDGSAMKRITVLSFLLLIFSSSVFAGTRSFTCTSYSGRCKMKIQYTNSHSEVKLETLSHPLAKECGISVGQKLSLPPTSNQAANGWQEFQGYSDVDDRSVIFRFNTPVMEESVFQARLSISLQGSTMNFMENSITCQ